MTVTVNPDTLTMVQKYANNVILLYVQLVKLMLLIVYFSVMQDVPIVTLLVNVQVLHA